MREIHCVQQVDGCWTFRTFHISIRIRPVLSRTGFGIQVQTRGGGGGGEGRVIE